MCQSSNASSGRYCIIRITEVFKLNVSLTQSNLFWEFNGYLDRKLNVASSFKRHMYMSKVSQAYRKFTCIKVVKTQINLESYPVPFVWLQLWMWTYFKSFVVWPPAKWMIIIIKSAFYIYHPKIFYPLMKWCLSLHNRKYQHQTPSKPEVWPSIIL